MRCRLLAMLALLLLLPVQAAGSTPELALLHFEPSATPWTDGVREGLAETAALPVREVFLDVSSLDEDAVDALYERLAGELAGSAFGAVVADGETAFAFARKFGPDLFPGAPKVFCAMGRPDPVLLLGCERCTGVTVRYDLKASVDLIFELRPQTNLVVVLADGTPATAPLMDAARQAMEPYMGRAQVMFPGFEAGDETGLDLKLLGDTLASVPSTGVVLFLGFNEDRYGNPVADETLANMIRTRSAAPVFVVRDALMASGVVGGWVVPARDVGRDAGRLVSRLLQGEPAGEMLPQPTGVRLRLDGTVLARYGMQPPAQAEVIRPPAAEMAEAPAGAEPVIPVLTWTLGLAVLVGLAALWRAKRRK